MQALRLSKSAPSFRAIAGIASYDLVAIWRELQLIIGLIELSLIHVESNWTFTFLHPEVH